MNRPRQRKALRAASNILRRRSTRRLRCEALEDRRMLAGPQVVSLQLNSLGVDPPDLAIGGQPTSWSQQRSRLADVVVTFNEDVSVSASDLVLTNLGADPDNDPDTIVGLSASHVDVDGSALTIDLSSLSLDDGVYRLEILPTVTNLAEEPLDGDGDGADGDSFVMSGDATNRLYQLTTDWNGDGGVSILDFSTYLYWVGQGAGTAPTYVDVSGDGGINVFDYVRFDAGFGTVAAGLDVPPPAPDGSAVTLEFVPDRGIVSSENGVKVVSVDPETAVTFTAMVDAGGVSLHGFHLNLDDSHLGPGGLELSGWTGDGAWPIAFSDSLDSPSNNFVSRGSFAPVPLPASLGTFTVSTPLTPGAFLLTASRDDDPFGTALIGPLGAHTIVDYGNVIIRTGDTTPPSVTLADASPVTEGDTAEFEVSLSFPLFDGVVELEYQTRNDSALAGQDFEPRTGTLTFASGETVKTISVPTIDDGEEEADERFFVTIFGATGATVQDGTGVGVIEDNDPFAINVPPVAFADLYQASEDTLLVADAGVLENDIDGDGDPLLAILVDDVQHGTLEFDADGSFSYQAHEDFFGTDSFTYRATDTAADSNVVDVAIVVSPVNDPPVALDDADYVVQEDGMLAVEALDGPLANDTDVDSTGLTAVLADDVEHGSLTLAPDGSFTYVPAEDFFGTDRFTYRASDGELESAPATVTIAVAPVVDSPLALDDEYDVFEDQVLVAGGTEPPGISPVAWSENGHQYLWVEQSSTAPAAIAAAANYQYRGSRGYLVTTTSQAENDFVRATFTSGLLPLALTDLAVEGDWRWESGEPFEYSNWAPGEPNNSGNEDYAGILTSGRWNDIDRLDLVAGYVVEFSGPFNVSVLENDVDPDGDVLTVSLLEDVDNGTLSLSDDGGFTYEPNENFVGTDMFTYQMNDGTGFFDTATVTIRVAEVDDPPVTEVDQYDTDEDVTLSVVAQQGVLANDSDEEGRPLTAQLVADVAHGALELNDDGSFVYTPVADFFGTDRFMYRALDGENVSDPVTVTITVAAVNDPPLAVDDSFTTDEDKTLNVTFAGLELVAAAAFNDDLGRYSDPLPNSPYALGQTVVGGGDGEPGWIDSWQLAVGPIDGGKVESTVTYEGDGAFRLVTIGSGDNWVERNLEHPQSGPLLVEQWVFLEFESAGIEGRVSGPNDMAALWRAKDGRFLVGDGTGVCSSVTIEETGFTWEPNQWYKVSLLVDPASQTYELLVNDVLYEPPDPLGFRCTNSTIDQIELHGLRDLSNGWVDDMKLHASSTRPGVLANDADVEADAMSVELVEDVANGTLSLNADGSFSYEPFADFIGTDTFSYRVSDGQSLSDTATVTLTVRFVDDAPEAVGDSYSVDEDTTLSVDAEQGVLANDSDEEQQPLTAVLSTTPAHGQLEFSSDGSFQYVPDPDFFGDDSFLYVAHDGVHDSEPVAVTLTVRPTPDAPIASDDRYTIDEDAVLDTSTFDGVLDNDLDVDGDTLIADPLTFPQYGSLDLNADGSFRYVPHSDFHGQDSFTYRARDGTGLSDTAVVTIDVNAVNDPPRALDDTYVLVGNETILIDAAAGVLANDSDAEGDAMSAEIMDQPAFGSLELSPDGSFRYAPGQAFVRSDSFTYRAGDGMSHSPPAVVTILADIPTIDVGDHRLLPDTPNQIIHLFVSGSQEITGVNIRVQIGDGSGPRSEPVFQSVDFTGGIWDGAATTTGGGPVPGAEQFVQANVQFNMLGVSTPADGRLVRLTVDTTGLLEGTFALLLTDTEIGVDTDFVGTPAHIVNGTITIANSTVVGRHVFYNDSYFDGDDPQLDARDDDAVATDKTALLPGRTATFANYTSSLEGITGIMVDLEGLTGMPTAADFEFRMGNDDDPTGWETAPAPSAISVRPGAGVDGADRVSIAWSGREIRQQWLQVTLRATGATGLPSADVFYFGNAVGDAGDSPNVAFVDGTDFVLARDHPRNFLNRAPIDFPYDYNRDSFVDGFDLAVARDNGTNFLTALKLITAADIDAVPPPGGGLAAAAIELPAPREPTTGANEAGDEVPAVSRRDAIDLLMADPRRLRVESSGAAAGEPAIEGRSESEPLEELLRRLAEQTG